MATRARNRLAPSFTPLVSNHAYDLRHRDGIPGGPAIIVAAPTPLAGVAGVAFSQSITGFVLGADAPPDSYGQTAISGTLGALGLSFNTATGVFSGASPVAGTYTYQLTATESGITNLAPATSQITIAPAPVAGDTLSPTTPYMLTVTPVTSPATAMRVTVDYPWDQRSATINPTEPITVPIEKRVDGGAFSVLTTFTPSPSTLKQPVWVPTLTQIGSATAGSVVVAANGDITLNGIVDGSFGNFADSMNFYGALVTLPVGGRVCFTLPQYSSVESLAAGGVIIRASLTSMEQSIAMLKRPSPQSANPLLSRATIGGQLTYTTDANAAGETLFVLERLISNGWLLQQYDASTGTILDVTTHSVIMPSQLYIGPFHTRTNPGTAVSFTVKQFSINVLGRPTIDDPAVSTGHLYEYRARGADSA